MLLSDTELVASLQRRENAGVQAMLDQYADRLYNYILYHCGDHHLAEDITSETFTRVIEKINRYVQRQTPFKAWLFRIAHNLLADHYRQIRRLNSVPLETADYRQDNSEWDISGGEMGFRSAQRDALGQAIGRLPADQRTVFLLRFVEGFDLEQTGELLDKSLAAIKSLQYRAVQQLRRELGPEQSKRSGQINYRG